MSMGKENWPELEALASVFSMELPGIETGTKISLTCGNAGLDYAKRRESTGNDLRNTRKVLMASTPIDTEPAAVTT